jgi:hypothetical protein
MSWNPLANELVVNLHISVALDCPRAHILLPFIPFFLDSNESCFSKVTFVAMPLTQSFGYFSYDQITA